MCFGLDFSGDFQRYDPSQQALNQTTALAGRDQDLYSQIYGPAVSQVTQRASGFGAGARLDEAQATAEKAVDTSAAIAESDRAKYGGVIDPQVRENFERRQLIDRTLAGTGARNVTRGRNIEFQDRLRSAAVDFGIGFRGDADIGIDALLRGEAGRNQLGFERASRENRRELDRVRGSQELLGQVVGFGAGLYLGS